MKQQHGSALIISLLILLVMTIIGISAMSNSTLEERMAANDRNQKGIFQNAETSLREAEATLAVADYNTEIRLALATHQKGYYTPDAPRFSYFTPGEWDPSSKCIAITNNSNNSGSSCYVIEENAIIMNSGEPGEYGSVSTPERGKQISRITMRSTDSNDTNPVIIQSNLEKIIAN